MTLPSILFAALIAAFYGALYHFIRGGRFWRLLFDLGSSAAGFAAGYFVSYWFGWAVIPLGSMDVGTASVGSLIFLVGGDWLSRIESKPQSTV